MEPADVVAAKAATDEKFRERVGEIIDLQGLPEHPGWATLKAHFDKEVKTYGQALAARMMHGELVNQREIDYMRGVRDMASRLFAYPQSALTSLERTAERLWEESLQNEAVSQLEESSPYLEGE